MPEDIQNVSELTDGSSQICWSSFFTSDAVRQMPACWLRHFDSIACGRTLS